MKSSCARTNMVTLSLKKEMYEQGKTILGLRKRNAKLKNQSRQEIRTETVGDRESAGDVSFSEMATIALYPKEIEDGQILC
jgi:hypothetical protein